MGRERERERERERKREKDERVEEEQGSLHRENGEKREDKKSKRKKLEHSSDSYSESDSEGSDSSESEEEDRRRHKRTSKKRRSSSRRRHGHSDSGSSSYESESECSDSEEERRRRKRRERKKREEREKEKERKRRRREKRRKRDEEDEKRRKKRKDKEKKKEKGKKGAVTNSWGKSWGKFGIIREVDMWNKRPEFTAWLMEVKEVNMESLPIYEEKKMFKEYMEDYNTATFPSKKYYNLDAYHKEKMEKEMRKGMKKVVATEMTVFNDEEQRRLELLQVREKQKQQEVESLKVAMQSGMAQAMKEQARLREEMQYLFKIGSHEAAAAIQRRLDPDVPM